MFVHLFQFYLTADNEFMDFVKSKTFQTKSEKRKPNREICEFHSRCDKNFVKVDSNAKQLFSLFTKLEIKSAKFALE